jgi:hypothetical protein
MLASTSENIEVEGPEQAVNKISAAELTNLIQYVKLSILSWYLD